MQCRTLEINLLSAYNLEDVRKLFRMKVYAVVSIAGVPRTEKKTPVDYDGGLNPAWNFTAKFTVSELAVEQTGVKIAIKLYCKRTLGDRLVGEVQVEMTDLYKAVSEHGGSAILSYPIITTTNKVSEQEEEEEAHLPRGVVNIWCKFGKTETVKPPSVANKVVVSGVMAFMRMLFRSKMQVDVPIGDPNFTGTTIDWAPLQG
ncbi:hypothetical protein Vadar_022904 [Vaccinium darrowii]|uniref:Uncharacterized protein n=1 Tax=Vaccinium darrowii TaxID=229202 RepID=A0ACB7X2X9_9ERIC|nr:hypothetical protein Vadar_022904 [Vaccinium darrowii]